MSWRSEGRVVQAAGPQKEQKEPIRRHDAQLSSLVAVWTGHYAAVWQLPMGMQLSLWTDLIWTGRPNYTERQSSAALPIARTDWLATEPNQRVPYHFRAAFPKMPFELIRLVLDT